MNEQLQRDVVVIGSGPAGQTAAITASRPGQSVLLVEQEKNVGGSCVHRGTIPSKTLRETAVSLESFRRRTGDVFELQVREELQVASLMTRMERVIRAHEEFQATQLKRAGVDWRHGKARIVDDHTVEIMSVAGGSVRVHANIIALATGSGPRNPPQVPIDHKNILDSDSILSMIYLPASLTVLGGGVIAAEYASIFTALGVTVTMVEYRDRPISFLDPELTANFLSSYRAAGGRFLGNRQVKSVRWDGVSAVETTLEDGEILQSEKLLCCLGRTANLAGLGVENTGVKVTSRGLIEVNEHFQTAVPHIYAIGDIIGPPSLASTSMEQGRRAMHHALGINDPEGYGVLPMGIYTIPEISSIGRSEQELIEQGVDIVVGRARFEEVARGQIGGITDGLLKLVANKERKLLGVHIVGEGAAELVHIGQMALLANAKIDTFLTNTFNFPTLAEAYRVAALDIDWKLESGSELLVADEARAD